MLNKKLIKPDYVPTLNNQLDFSNFYYVHVMYLSTKKKIY
jgi:hypothetical protein